MSAGLILTVVLELNIGSLAIGLQSNIANYLLKIFIDLHTSYKNLPTK